MTDEELAEMVATEREDRMSDKEIERLQQFVDAMAPQARQYLVEQCPRLIGLGMAVAYSAAKFGIPVAIAYEGIRYGLRTGTIRPHYPQ